METTPKSLYKVAERFEFEIDGKLFEFSAGQVYEFTDEQVTAIGEGKLVKYEDGGNDPETTPEGEGGEKLAEPGEEGEKPTPQDDPGAPKNKETASTPAPEPKAEETQQSVPGDAAPNLPETGKTRAVEPAKPWVGGHSVMGANKKK